MAKLHFYYSAMNAGKSTTLLQSNHNYHERGLDTLLYAPLVDTRYGVGKISTRIGLQSEALSIAADTDLFADIISRYQQNTNIRCVLIDEAQFLSQAQVLGLTQVVDELDIPVLAYGLRTDYKGEPFVGSLYLLALADQLIEIKTICHCGSKATMNMRIDEHGHQIKTGMQIHIGGNEAYVATCRRHFRLGNSGLAHKIKKAMPV